jgi:hypothetical protein
VEKLCGTTHRPCRSARKAIFQPSLSPHSGKGRVEQYGRHLALSTPETHNGSPSLPPPQSEGERFGSTGRNRPNHRQGAALPTKRVKLRKASRHFEGGHPIPPHPDIHHQSTSFARSIP